MRRESNDPWLKRQPLCCVGVECVARSLGNVTLTTWAEAVCRDGCHRISEVRGVRSVYDLRTGEANAVARMVAQ